MYCQRVQAGLFDLGLVPIGELLALLRGENLGQICHSVDQVAGEPVNLLQLLEA